MAIETSTTAPAGLAAVRRIDELGHDDIPYAGGKGANLGELTQAGFPVPPGFVVGAPAYAAFCDGSGLRSRLSERLAGARRLVAAAERRVLLECARAGAG